MTFAMNMLFALEPPPQSVASLLSVFGPALIPALVGFTAIYLLLPQARSSRPFVGIALGAMAIVALAIYFISAGRFSAESVLFIGFSLLAVLGAGMMVVHRNPAYSALSFALTVLSSCGLFLLQGAPFLTAATIIVYAGAIVVTFLFVLMLAQQAGPSNADHRTREPFLSTIAGFVILGSLVFVLHGQLGVSELDQVASQLDQVTKATTIDEVKRVLGDPKQSGAKQLALTTKLEPLIPGVRRAAAGDPNLAANPVLDLEERWVRLDLEPIKVKAAEVLAMVRARRDRVGTLHGDEPIAPLPAENVTGLGRLLFTQYLVPVEMAAVLLLVATIGAIAIAGRRSEDLR